LIQTVTDQDIRIVQNEFGPSFDFGDPERSAVLKCSATKDIVACAGSGKTTLLVAKLSILARGWPYAHRGIAVLSHTNAAREAITSKLPTDLAHRVTDYPHFVGTIQSFVDRFLAIPACIEYYGQRPSPDDDRLCHALRAIYRKRQNELTAAANHIRRRMKANPAYEGTFFRELQYVLKDDELWLPIVRKSSGDREFYKTSSNTYREFSEIKSEAQNAGIWGYRDMYALAAKYIADCPRISELARWRFPLLLLDEMQDTSSGQWALLDSVFGAETVVQRFGDLNQAILGDRPDSNDELEGIGFPRPDSLTVRQSLRLSCSIAKLVRGVAVQDIDLLGCAKLRDNLPHTVFLFDVATAPSVLPEFGHLVLTSFGDDALHEGRVVAIGYVQKRRDPSEDKFPYSICDYWDQFVPRESRTAARLDGLGDYVLSGCADVLADGDCGQILQKMMEGLSELMRRNSTPNPKTGRPFTPASLRDYLHEMQSDAFELLKRDLFRRCRAAEKVKSVDVKRLDSWARGLLSPLCSGKWKTEAVGFLQKEPCVPVGPQPERSPSADAENVFVFQEGGRSVAITVGTIPSEKGKTHLATLVLHTHCYQHDIPTILPWITGQPHEQPKGQTSVHLRRIHVAMTRPRELLCLAVCKDALPNGFDASALVTRGWQVNDLAPSRT
jgi:hypothetical protein